MASVAGQWGNNKSFNKWSGTLVKKSENVFLFTDSQKTNTDSSKVYIIKGKL